MRAFPPDLRLVYLFHRIRHPYPALVPDGFAISVTNVQYSVEEHRPANYSVNGMKEPSEAETYNGVKAGRPTTSPSRDSS